MITVNSILLHLSFILGYKANAPEGFTKEANEAFVKGQSIPYSKYPILKGPNIPHSDLEMRKYPFFIITPFGFGCRMSKHIK